MKVHQHTFLPEVLKIDNWVMQRPAPAQQMVGSALSVLLVAKRINQSNSRMSSKGGLYVCPGTNPVQQVSLVALLDMEERAVCVHTAGGRNPFKIVHEAFRRGNTLEYIGGRGYAGTTHDKGASFPIRVGNVQHREPSTPCCRWLDQVFARRGAAGRERRRLPTHQTCDCISAGGARCRCAGGKYRPRAASTRGSRLLPVRPIGRDKSSGACKRDLRAVVRFGGRYAASSDGKRCREVNTGDVPAHMLSLFLSVHNSDAKGHRYERA